MPGNVPAHMLCDQPQIDLIAAARLAVGRQRDSLAGEEMVGQRGDLSHLDFAKSLAAEIPGAKLVVLPDQGHYYYFSDAATTNRVIREFIAQ